MSLARRITGLVAAHPGNWSTAANWGGTAPDIAGDSLVFSGSSQPINTNDSVTSVITVQLNPGVNFTISGNPL